MAVGCKRSFAARTTSLLALLAPPCIRQNFIRAEGDDERWDRADERPDPEREEQQLPVLAS